LNSVAFPPASTATQKLALAQPRPVRSNEGSVNVGPDQLEPFQRYASVCGLAAIAVQSNGPSQLTAQPPPLGLTCAGDDQLPVYVTYDCPETPRQKLRVTQDTPLNGSLTTPGVGVHEAPS
jgi:hypothetical protein